MLLDAELIFMEGQAVTASAAGSKVIDTLKGGNAIGHELFLRVFCGTSAAAAGAATVAFKLRTSETADGNGALSNPTVLALTPPIAKADLVSGRELWCIRMPYGAKRYLDVYAEVAAGPLTAGKFTAFLSTEK